MVEKHNNRKRSRRNIAASAPTQLVIHEPSNSRTSSGTSSDGEDVQNELAASFPTRSILTSIKGFEQGESSKGRKRSRESTRYANLTPEQKQARRDRERVRRQCLAPEVREDINARRRAHRKSLTHEERNARQQARRQSLTAEQREVMNARTRKHRQSITPEERQALLTKRRMSYAARRDTPCDESIAVRCPEARGASRAENPSSYTPTLTIGTKGKVLTPTHFCCLEGCFISYCLMPK